MDNSVPTFINVSIFYETEGWHSLLNDCVRPCIDQLYNDGGRNDCLIYLNSDKGNNIRISIRADKQRCNSTLTLVDDFLKEYIKGFPGPVKKIVYPLKNIFLDFPENSVQYNLFTAPANCPRFAIRQLVSANILEELAKDVVDIESIMAYDLYVHFQFLKSFQEVYGNKQVFRSFQSAFNQEMEGAGKKNVPDIVYNELSEAYEINKNVIAEIYQMVFSDGLEFQLEFLLEWDAEFKKMMEPGATITLATSIFPVIQEHLGMSFIQRQFGLFVINKLLLEKDFVIPGQYELSSKNNKEIV